LPPDPNSAPGGADVGIGRTPVKGTGAASGRAGVIEKLHFRTAARSPDMVEFAMDSPPATRV